MTARSGPQMGLMRRISVGRLFGLCGVLMLDAVLWTPLAPAAAFEERIIESQSSAPDDPWTKTCGDLDGDGDPDLIIGGHGGGGLVWYENPGWQKHWIAQGGGFGTDAEVADIDRDGDADVVVIRRNSLIWYENDPDSQGDWPSHSIDGNRSLHDIVVSDFDDDQDADIVGRDQSAFGGSGDRLHFYEQSTGDAMGWTHHAVSVPEGEGIAVGDLDRDGDPDVVVNRYWYENDGTVAGGDWKRHQYSAGWAHPHVYIDLADIDGDGRDDIVMSPSERDGTYRIAWFEAPGTPTDPWEEHVVDRRVEVIHHFVGTGDFDGDGWVDIATAEMSQSKGDDQVKIYFNEEQGGEWTKQVLSNDGSHSMRILDVDRDGDLDLFGANWRANGRDEHIKLWENKSK